MKASFQKYYLKHTGVISFGAYVDFWINSIPIEDRFEDGELDLTLWSKRRYCLRLEICFSRWIFSFLVEI